MQTRKSELARWENPEYIKAETKKEVQHLIDMGFLDQDWSYLYHDLDERGIYSCGESWMVQEYVDFFDLFDTPPMPSVMYEVKKELFRLLSTRWMEAQHGHQ